MLPASALQQGERDSKLQSQIPLLGSSSPITITYMFAAGLKQHVARPGKVRNKILSYGFGSALGSGLCASVDFLAPHEDEDAEGNEFRYFAAACR